MKLSFNPEIVSRAHVLYSMRGELLICSPNMHIITSFPCTCCLTIILPCGDLLWLKHCAKGSCAFAPLCCVCCDWLCHFKQTLFVEPVPQNLQVIRVPKIQNQPKTCFLGNLLVLGNPGRGGTTLTIAAACAERFLGRNSKLQRRMEK